MNEPINIVFDRPPGHDSGRFVDVELDDGSSIKIGEWVARKNGKWALRITELPCHEDYAADQLENEVTTIRRQTIWKFEFKIEDTVSLDMPIGAQVLDVQAQRGTPCIWALVDPHAERCKRLFRVYGTGHPVDVTEDHVGSFQLAEGSLVFHIFEVV